MVESWSPERGTASREKECIPKLGALSEGASTGSDVNDDATFFRANNQQ